MTNPLKAWRDREKLSRLEVGEMFSVDQQTVYRWETGEHLPRPKYWADLESKTGISVSELIPHIKIDEAAR